HHTSEKQKSIFFLIFSVTYKRCGAQNAICRPSLKRIYQSVTAEEAESELSAFESAWGEKFPSIGKSWRKNWDNLITLFDYPKEVRKAIYTTNAIESLNSVIRKAIKNRKIFPTDDAVLKVIYLATEKASAKWTMPIRDWKAAMNRFEIMFPDRIKV
uniref:transposase n=1 Tax=Candidatus Sororendozoicomonas aggregata TaxID=3073239 RepID=UPI002ED2C019